MSEKMTNQGSLELSTKQQARFEKYFELLSFEVVPVSEAALVNSGWTSYQILDINLPFLWA
jgi:hypothetical protein